MGIYLFKRDTLIQLLNAPPLATDFGKEIFPRSLHSHHTQAYLFDGYWEDVGTVKSYHEANLALCDPNPPFEMNSTAGVIYTRACSYLHRPRRIDSAQARSGPEDQRRLRHRRRNDDHPERHRRPDADRQEHADRELGRHRPRHLRVAGR